jgi:signal transduction histidine kinase
VNDLLVMSLADLSLALAVVHLSGGWDSPYYLYAVSALLIPSSLLGLVPNLVLAVGFDIAYLIVLATSGDGTDGPWLHGEVNNFVVFLAVPILVAIVVQFFGWIGRQLNEEREIARAALEENIRLQQEREELAAEHERNRIAREIHDGIAQSIYMLSLNLEAAADATANEPALSQRLHQLVSLSKQALLEVRHYIFDLKPLLSGDTTLAGALQSQIREFTAVSGLPVDLDVQGRDRALAPAVTTALYRVAQESLANVFRHARATEASVTLRMDARSVTLEVCDNGAGFHPRQGEGRGLANMRQRMEELAGDLRVESVPGEGTRVIAILTVEG